MRRRTDHGVHPKPGAPQDMTQTSLLEEGLEESSDLDFQATDSVGWNAEITRRLRVMLYAEPLFRLKIRGDAQLGEDHDLGHYDSIALVFKIFDVVLERTGLESEIDTAGLVRELRPMFIAMDQARGFEPNEERHLRATERVVGWLLNEGGRREPYTVEYADFDEPGYPAPGADGSGIGQHHA